MPGPAALGAHRGVGDAASLCALPRPQDPGEAIRVIQGLKGVHFNLIRGGWDPSDRLSSSRRVPLSRASSRSCILRRSFWSSGVSMPCFRMFLIWGVGGTGGCHRGGCTSKTHPKPLWGQPRTCSTAFLTFSMVLAVTRACRGSSSPGSICPSLRPTLPSFTEPLPLIMILALHSFSMFFSVFPLAGTPRQQEVTQGFGGDTQSSHGAPLILLSPFPWVVIVMLCLGILGGRSHTQTGGLDPMGCPPGSSGAQACYGLDVSLNNPVLIRGGGQPRQWEGKVVVDPLDWGNAHLGVFRSSPHSWGEAEGIPASPTALPPPRTSGCLPGPDEEPHKVDLGVLILRDHHLVAHPRRWRPWGRTKKKTNGVQTFGGSPKPGGISPKIRAWGVSLLTCSQLGV